MAEIESKLCWCCEREKPIKSFPKNSGRNARLDFCRKCFTDYSFEYRKQKRKELIIKFLKD